MNAAAEYHFIRTVSVYGAAVLPLLETLRKYHNRAIETAQVIEELIQMAKKFKEAAEAYEVLSNPDKRSRYDQFGFAGVDGAAGGGSGFGGFGGQGMSMDDIFSMFGDIFGGQIGRAHV